MMKIAVFIALVGVCAGQFRGQQQQARPPAANLKSADIVNLRSEFENTGDGNYFYIYENNDGTLVQQRGSVKPPPPGEEFPIQVAEGSYQHYAPEGNLIKIEYLADENGYNAKGDALPTPPPIPEEILRATKEAYKNAAAQIARAKNQPQSNKRF